MNPQPPSDEFRNLEWTRDVEICLGADEEHPFGAIPPPIVQTSLFAKRTFQDLVDGLAAEHTQYMYTRGQNPTVELLETKLASLERGEACKCFSSGMAAISAVFLGLLRQGDHVLFVNQIYGPTLQLARHLEGYGILHDVVIGWDPERIERTLRRNTRMIYFESPSTMVFQLLPIAEIVHLAKTRGILTAIDNTWATPLFQKPLTLGVDLVVHSCTKYIGGHSDVVAGALIGPASEIDRVFRSAFMLNGGILAPFDAWLLIRGLRTLPLRMKRHEASALEVARFLENHPAVRRVFHPLRDGDNGRLAKAQMTGCSGLFSFEMADDRFDQVAGFIDGLRHFRKGVSWGGYDSLVISPNRGGKRDRLLAQGIPPGLVRLSIGLENAEVLMADLDQALQRVDQQS